MIPDIYFNKEHNQDQLLHELTFAWTARLHVTARSGLWILVLCDPLGFFQSIPVQQRAARFASVAKYLSRRASQSILITTQTIHTPGLWSMHGIHVVYSCSARLESAWAIWRVEVQWAAPMRFYACFFWSKLLGVQSGMLCYIQCQI